MAKFSIASILSSFFSSAALNNNFQAITDELNSKVLYRDNPGTEPNAMSNDLDMSTNDLLNVGSADVTSLTVGGNPVVGTNPGASFDGIVLMNDLLALSPVNDDSILVSGFYNKSDGGGGTFFYDATASKTTHNGGTIIDPDIGVIPGAAGWWTAPGSGVGVWVKNTIVANVLDFGARGDAGTTDNTLPIQAALDSGASEIYFPDGEYYTTAVLTVDVKINLCGTQPFRNATGGVHIKNTGTGDCMHYSDTITLYDCTVSNIALTSNNGHALNIKNGAVRCLFQNLRLDSRSVDHSALYGDYTSTGAGMFTCRFIGGEYFGANTVDRNVPIIDLKTTATKLNENIFRDMWISYSTGIHAVSIQAVPGGATLTNNVIESINFEACGGGLIRLGKCANTKIIGISAWDESTYTSDLITLESCSSTTVIGFGRVGGTPDAGKVDILAQGTGGGLTVINYSDVGAVDEAIDWGGQTGNYVGSFSATLVHTNASRVVRLDGDTAIAPIFQTAGGNKFTDSSGGSFIDSPAGPVKLRSVVSGNTQLLQLDASVAIGGAGSFFPNSDNTLDLGQASNRYQTIYAGTGSIDTSDAREKQQVTELTEAERKVAIKLKGLVRTFKFNDAVEAKGDGARIHCGVMAQDVCDAFAEEGLDPTAYALLCYDEWDDKPPIYDKKGELIEAGLKAGNRYGVRYTELLCFVMSAM